MSAETLTVLMPLKNYHAPFLEQALGSLDEQTSPAWALVVVVEPEDETKFAGVLAPWLGEPRIHMVTNAGRGLSGAINTGMGTASTPFVALLLADDRWTADAVATLARYREAHPSIDFFHSARRVIDDQGNLTSKIFPSRETFDTTDFRRGSPVKHLLCWRREKGLAVGGLDESLNGVGPDDYDFPWTMLEGGASFQAVSECLYEYRHHVESYRLTTHQTRAHHRHEIRRIMEKHGVPATEIRTHLRRATKSFLRQCLYRNDVERWLREWFRIGHRRHRLPRYR